MLHLVTVFFPSLLTSLLQVKFGMVVVLVWFALILFVVIMGFAMALFSRLRDADTFNFEDILLLLFKTLLSDVEAFHTSDNSTQDNSS